MIARSITGLKIRETRRILGLKQNELARRVGISASYLNLIERNKRAIGGMLLNAIGRELALSVDELDGTTERRLRHQLVTLAEDSTVGTGEMRDSDIDAFIARHPAWARGAARAYAAFRAAETEVEALSDRLAHDPVLAETVHAMLTEIAALRSTAEILADPREIEPGQRRRFERIVDDQSARLARTATALAAHFDETAEARRPRTTIEEAEEYLHHSDAGDALEAAGGRLRSELSDGAQDLERALAAAQVRPPAIAADWGRTRRIAALALGLAQEAPVPEIAAALQACPPAAVPHARAALVQRLADAIRLPAGHVMALGTRLDWDLDALVRAADGDGALVFRRIADLHRSGAPRAGLVVADASGATLARAGALDLLPRARQLDCPVWPLHRAGPNGVVRADVQLSAGDRRVVLALGRPDGMASDMLVFAASPRIDTAPPAPHLAVGPGCRICTHRACPQRREPSVVEA
jgi:predicted transcriptional regulator/transcriptional regulator with XRE-family HTH domain